MASLFSVGDMPTITDSAHTHTAYSGANWDQPIGAFAADFLPLQAEAAKKAVRLAQLNQVISSAKHHGDSPVTPGTRYVQVLVADPDTNLPLDQRLIYKGDPKLTDSTDQELFFELDIKSLLETHNAERVKYVDKSVKDRTQQLEPAKIRELRMVVTIIASF